jgi:polyhydroxyalkanoate synthesis regulator protein
MTKPTHPRVLRYQRSRVYPRAVLFDANLDLHSLHELRTWQRDGVPFTVIDAETNEDITHILLA